MAAKRSAPMATSGPTRSVASMLPDAVAAWCGTLSSVLPAATRMALGEYILQERLDGHTFSALLNQHSLGSLGVKGLTLAMAQKVRKCWHLDFPEAADIQEQVHFSPEPAPVVVDRVPSSREPLLGSSGRRTGAAVAGGTVEVAAALRKAPGPEFPSAGATVELLRAALDRVAERAGLDRREVYLWVHGALPNEVWQPLWDRMTEDLLRQQGEPPWEQAPGWAAEQAHPAAPSSPVSAWGPTPSGGGAGAATADGSFLETFKGSVVPPGARTPKGGLGKAAGAFPARTRSPASPSRGPVTMAPQEDPPWSRSASPAPHRGGPAFQGGAGYGGGGGGGFPDDGYAGRGPAHDRAYGGPGAGLGGAGPAHHDRGGGYGAVPSGGGGSLPADGGPHFGGAGAAGSRVPHFAGAGGGPPYLGGGGAAGGFGDGGYGGSFAGGSGAFRVGGAAGPGAAAVPGTNLNSPRSVAGLSVSQGSEEAVAAWLQDGGRAPRLSPIELAQWLQRLPAGKVTEEAKKRVARCVLDDQIDGKTFEERLVSGRWAEMAIEDERQAGVMARLLKQRQHEARMAEAAVQNARFYAGLKGMKGEMLVA